jgi:hypothetical protein
MTAVRAETAAGSKPIAGRDSGSSGTGDGPVPLLHYLWGSEAEEVADEPAAGPGLVAG